MAKLACGMAHKHRPLGAAKGSSPNAPWSCPIAGGGLLGRNGRYYWPSHTGPDLLALGNTCYGGQVEVKLKRRKILFSTLSFRHLSNRLSGENSLTNI